MAYEFYDAEVIDIINETDKVRRFYMKVKDFPNYSFIPGQFAMLHLPIESKDPKRSYSIASAPNDNNTIEMIIVEKEGGIGTKYLFEQVHQGSILKISKPLGKFVLQQPVSTELCFIATGTGVAPFRSIILDMVNKKIPFPKITLIFGTRYEKDILYHKEFTSLQQTLSNFQYIPVLSRETSESWKGEKGYVHQVYEKLYQDKRPSVFYLCGWAVMIDEARAKLHTMGYDRKQIKFEVYD